ncbi:MAG: hypothetical protein ACC645_17005, partial [Pirellulales bacterium]
GGPGGGGGGGGGGVGGGPGGGGGADSQDGDSDGGGPGGGGGAGGGSGSSESVTSVDPNEKTGPGYGDAGFVGSESALPYRVDFENDAEATAPAQRVDITDQLSADLDWNTLEFTEIGFADTIIAVPPGSQYFQTTVGMHYNNQDFDVDIQLSLQSETGLIRVSFQSIDPGTSLPPDVLTGFLPPEDGTGRGMGYFSYVIDSVPGLPTGTEIRNIALITFDRGETIATNQIDPHDPIQGTNPGKEALVTIDAGAPESSVVTLPAFTRTEAFLVDWGGTDDAGGSGIGSYDVYVATDGGPSVVWLEDTTDTSALFGGEGGRTYAFASTARDNVGHEEAVPVAPDTETFVALYADMDFDGDTDFDDINDFVLGLTQPDAYLATFGLPATLNGDLDQDGDLDFDDLDDFVAVLVGGTPIRAAVTATDTGVDRFVLALLAPETDGFGVPLTASIRTDFDGDGDLDFDDIPWFVATYGGTTAASGVETWRPDGPEQATDRNEAILQTRAARHSLRSELFGQLGRDRAGTDWHKSRASWESSSRAMERIEPDALWGDVVDLALADEPTWVDRVN